MEMYLQLAKNSTRGVIASGLSLMILLATNSLAQVNKCNVNGRIVYTDNACPNESARPLQLEPLNTTSATVPVSGEDKAGQSSYNSSRWFIDHAGYATALKVSREQNAPIFIYAYTDWCPYCRKLEREMFPDSQVKSTMAGYVKVKLNPEHSAADQKLFKQWGGRGYPTLYIQTSLDSPPVRAITPFSKHNGKWKLMKKETFIGELESKLQPATR
jgi:thiol:disulfide interchange protein